jgi:hypothetical protein
LHNPALHWLLAAARGDELRRAGAGEQLARAARAHAALPPPERTVTLRPAFPDDDCALARLASLDSATPPTPPVLLAEVGGEIRAALSLTDGTVVADPFHATAGLVALLRTRAKQLVARDPNPGQRRLFRLRAQLR